MFMSVGAIAFISFAIEPSGNYINLWTGIVLYIVVIFNCTLAYHEEKASSNVMA